MTEVEDLGIDSLASGRERMRLKVLTSSAYCETECQTELLPDNKGGQDHVEGGLDQKQPLRAEPQRA